MKTNESTETGTISTMPARTIPHFRTLWMTRIRAGVLFCVLLVVPIPAIEAASVAVPRADFDTFNLDIDLDGPPEITWLSIEMEGVVGLSGYPPDDWTFPGGGILGPEAFASIGDLSRASLFSGAASLIAALEIPPGSAQSNAHGSFPFNLSTPILAMWFWGTRHNYTVNTPQHNLVGWVVDASDHVADPSQPVTIYYHDYGPFTEGETRIVSLAATGVPEPSMVFSLGAAALILLARKRR